MADLVVTVPRELWADWIAEGDAVGEPESGVEWGFLLGRNQPPIGPGERLYVVAHDRLRGYAPVTSLMFYREEDCGHLLAREGCEICDMPSESPSRPRMRSGRLVGGRWAVGRKGGAVAVAIPPKYSIPLDFEQAEMAKIRGFQGFRRRWWPREAEFPFLDWASRDLWLNRAKGRRAARVADAKRKKTGKQQSLF